MFAMQRVWICLDDFLDRKVLGSPVGLWMVVLVGIVLLLLTLCL